MRKTAYLAIAFSGLAAAQPALAAPAMTVTLDLPTLKVAEYHRPYVALWIENADQEPVRTLAVWYNVRKPNGDGAHWLKDMRQWWRKAGREMTLPADGVSGPTRAPGKQQLMFAGGKSPLQTLPPGAYTLVAEAAREVGGREMIKAPFSWPPAKAQSTSVSGAGDELSALTLAVTP